MRKTALCKVNLFDILNLEINLERDQQAHFGLVNNLQIQKRIINLNKFQTVSVLVQQSD